MTLFVYISFAKLDKSASVPFQNIFAKVIVKRVALGASPLTQQRFFKLVFVHITEGTRAVEFEELEQNAAYPFEIVATLGSKNAAD